MHLVCVSQHYGVIPTLKIIRNVVKRQQLFDKYKCTLCNCLLKDAVQSSACGLLFCIVEFKDDDGKDLRGQDKSKYSPSMVVRHIVNCMEITCPYCEWNGTLEELADHRKTCTNIPCRASGPSDDRKPERGDESEKQEAKKEKSLQSRISNLEKQNLA